MIKQIRGQNLKFVLENIVNIVGTGENAGIFSPPPPFYAFKRLFSQELIKVDCVVKATQRLALTCNSLILNEKFLDQSKLKAFADNKLNVTKKSVC